MALRESIRDSDISGSAPSDMRLERRLSRLSLRAALALWWELLWPSLVPVLCVVALFVAMSWTGLFAALPHWARIAVLGLFGAALLAAVVPLALIVPPVVSDILRRIDRDSGARHGLASVWADRLGAGSGDVATQSLWEAHRRRIRVSLANARVAWPRPGMAERDRYALRAAPLLLLAAAFFASGPDRLEKVAGALDPRAGPGTSVEARIDGWIDPPAYTRVPPMVIDFAKAVNGEINLRAPIGSSLVLRWPERAGVNVKPITGFSIPTKPIVSAGVSETRWRLTENGSMLVTGGVRESRLSIATIPDEPPTIRIIGEPKTNIRGTVTLSYEGTDDYGIASVETRFADPKWRGKALAGRMLVEPPSAKLTPPSIRPGAQPTRDTFDLSSHPWAGTEVTMKLAAKDDAGQEGESEPATLTLPEHPFTKPLARALVEQRRKLALDADTRPQVQEALYALLIAPERFMPQPGIYVSLRSITRQLASSVTNDQLVGVVSDLWELALVIEGSGPTRALDQLRAAERALKEALANGASKEEIEQRMAELRQALDKYLRELADRARENPNSKQSDSGKRMMTQHDLQQLLDKLGDLAKNGDREMAQRMLDQLQNLLDNLQTAEGDQDGADDQQLSQEEQALDEMSELLRKELELRDDTQSADRQRQSGKRSGQKPGQQQGQQGKGGQDQAQQGQGSGQNGLDGLSERQKRLRQRLQELGKKLGGMGSDEAGKSLGDAGREMQDAENSLGQGDPSGATGAEGRAIEALRKGMNALSDQLAQQQQQQGGQQGQAGRGRGRSRMVRGGVDPLGRGVDRADDEYGEGDYDNGQGYGRRNGLEGNVAERARQILQELRRRLGDPSRAQEELEYIERLLKTQ
jgi:uncharacterized protein (TIGR02302 family)